MIKHSMEWNEILGDMVDDVREEREIWSDFWNDKERA